MKNPTNIRDYFKSMTLLQKKGVKEFLSSKCNMPIADIEKAISGRWIPSEEQRSKLNYWTGQNLTYGKKTKPKSYEKH